MSAKDDGGPAWTPGPWIIVQDDPFANLSIRSGNARDASHISYLQICADITGLRKKSEKYVDTEAQANARLISAAPDMYEALRVARIYVSDAVVVCKAENLDFAEFEKDLAQIDAALAKAGIKERAK